jgi:hypothetical protein
MIVFRLISLIIIVFMMSLKYADPQKNISMSSSNKVSIENKMFLDSAVPLKIVSVSPSDEISVENIMSLESAGPLKKFSSSTSRENSVDEKISLESAVPQKNGSVWPSNESLEKNTSHLQILYKKPNNSSPFWIEIAALHQIPGSRMKSSSYIRASEYQEGIAEPFPTLIDALVDSGAGGTRVYLEWRQIENEPLQYSWNWYDARLSQIGELGLQIIVNIDEPPKWALPTTSSSCPPIIPDRLDEFARFLKALVNRYKVPPFNVKHWELFNEPDNITFRNWQGCRGYYGENYSKMLSVAYPAIKSADPDAVVLLGGIAYDWFMEDSYMPGECVGCNFGPFYRLFPDEVIQAGGAPFFDALNFHYFPSFAPEWERWVPGNLPTCDYPEGLSGNTYQAGGIDLIAKASHYRNRMATCHGVNKPVWVTELGEHGYPGNSASLAQQARYVIKGNVRGMAAGVEKIVWYALTTPNDEDEQQLLYDDWSPKPGFYAFKKLTSELRGYEYDRTLNISNVEGYVFANNSGSEKVVAWGSGSLTFTPASQLRVVDRDGNVTIIQDGGSSDLDGVQNGRIQFQTTKEPFFIKIF